MNTESQRFWGCSLEKAEEECHNKKSALLGVVLYILIRPYAVAARGSTLYGGEVMMFGMPAYWAVLKSIINDVKQVLTERNYQDN